MFAHAGESLLARDPECESGEPIEAHQETGSYVGEVGSGSYHLEVK